MAAANDSEFDDEVGASNDDKGDAVTAAADENGCE
jgi:hypothetical protein